jgi:hypothetical protein
MFGGFSKPIARRRELQAWCDGPTVCSRLNCITAECRWKRSVRRADAPPLGIIRSMAYFSPVIEEVLQLKVGQEYFQHLRSKLRRTTAAR